MGYGNIKEKGGGIEMMKILLTGSNGFIGRHAVRYLKERGHYVIGLGRSKESVSGTDMYIECDLSKEKDRSKLKRELKGDIDAVVHMAADMRKEPYTTNVVETNCVGTQGLLEICDEKKIRVFVQLSSLPVIGIPKQHPITEEHPTEFHSVYHATKAMQEHLAQYTYGHTGMATASFRISSPIGPGADERTIMPVFIKNAIYNRDIEIYGRGSRIQTFIHVDDVSAAMLEALKHPAALGGVFLILHPRIAYPIWTWQGK